MPSVSRFRENVTVKRWRFRMLQLSPAVPLQPLGEGDAEKVKEVIYVYPS